MAKILLVKKNESYSRLLADSLITAGHEVIFAHSRCKALEFYLLEYENPFEIVITDIDIPDQEKQDVYDEELGIKLIEDIRNNKTFDKDKIKKIGIIKRKKVFTQFILLIPINYEPGYFNYKKNRCIALIKNTRLPNNLTTKILKQMQIFRKKRYHSLIMHFCFCTISLSFFLFCEYFRLLSWVAALTLVCLNILILILYFQDYIKPYSPEYNKLRNNTGA